MRSRNFEQLYIFVAIVVCGLTFPLQVNAAGPGLVNYQGFLRDDSEVPVEGLVDMSFAVFDAEMNGNQLWSESHQGTLVTDGVFHVILGSLSALDASIFDNEEVWLETTIEGDVVQPRRRFLSTPYTMRASVADVALTAIDGLWDENGADIYFDAGAVGIGVPSPVASHHVRGTVLGLTGEALQGETIAAEDDDAVVGLYSSPNASYGSALVLGELTGGALVDKWALVRRTSGSGSALRFTYGANSNYGLNATRFTIATDGNVGIGTSNPTSSLTVVGEASVVGDLAVAGESHAEVHIADTDLGESALPAEGGVYRDNVVYAWAHIDADGTIVSSFGVDSVQLYEPGLYGVFPERYLNGGASVTVTPISLTERVMASAEIVEEPQGLIGVRISAWIPESGGFEWASRPFYVQVTGRP